MFVGPIRQKTSAIGPVSGSYNQDVSRKIVRVPTASASNGSSGRIEDPPQELRRLMAIDRNVVPSNYWVAGVGWDLAEIRKDYADLSSGRRPLRVATDHHDNEGRIYDKGTIVINFVDVASSYGLRYLRDVDDDDENKVHWEGVRLCLKYMIGKLRYKVIGIIFQNWRAYDGPLDNLSVLRGVPPDVLKVCEFVEETPNLYLSQHRNANDEMTIKLAYRRNCRILDNDDYSGWIGIAGLRNEKIRKWLEQCQEILHMNYKFMWDREFCDFEICSFTRRNVSRSGGVGDVGKAEVNKLREGWTPLCTAAKAGDLEMVKRLLGHGANPNVANSEGVYPVYFAALECNVEMVEALKEHGADLSLIPRAKFQGLIGNVHWRLGKQKYTSRRRRLLVLLGMDANSRDPLASDSTVNIEAPMAARGSSSISADGVPRQRTKRTRGWGASNVVRVHSSPPRKSRRSHRAADKPRTLGLHPKFPYRRLLRIGRKRKKKNLQAAPVTGSIDLEAIDLTQEADPTPRRLRRPLEKDRHSRETDAVYLKVMRTTGPDARPMIAMIDPYI